MTTFSHSGPGARHEAFLYTSAQEFGSLTAAFVAEGLESDESAVVITSAENLEAFRTALDDPSPLVFVVDGDDWYRKPAETVGRWVGFVEGQVARGHRRVRGVGEIAPLRRGHAVDEWLHYESILNELLAPLPLWARCAYNTETLPDSIIEDARTSHPTVIERGAASASDSYLPPRRTPPQSLPLDGRPGLTQQPVDVAGACSYVEAEARRAGMGELQVQHLLSAVCEVARNAFVHGSAPVFVTAWPEDGSLVCQIEDEGGGIDDLTAGYRPPAKGDTAGACGSRARPRTHSTSAAVRTAAPFGSRCATPTLKAPEERPRPASDPPAGKVVRCRRRPTRLPATRTRLLQMRCSRDREASP